MKKWSIFFAVWILFCLITGCATNRPKRDLIVLLPDPDGKTGAIIVTTNGGSQSLDKPGYVTEVDNPNKPPTSPRPLNENEMKEIFGPDLSAQQDLSNRFLLFILYFENDSTKFTHVSALNPIRIFSHADATEQIRVRIDDKIARVQSGQLDEDEDVIIDLMGYLVL